MSGFVEEARSIDDCLSFVAEGLGFPWNVRRRTASVADALFSRSSIDIRAPEPYPPFTRSLRDGYAIDHSNTVGASASAPVFLRLAGEVLMGSAPSFKLAQDEAASIPTGGMLPENADSVVMAENTITAGDWIEIRSSVQSGENIIRAAEEIAEGDILLRKGEIIDKSAPGLLAAFGISSVSVMDIRIGIISTGDEILPIETSPLPMGFIRDSNTLIIQSVLSKYGLPSTSYGIVPDIWESLDLCAEKAIHDCDVVLLSGGSSVGARDHTARLIDSLSIPGLLARGINMTPGKPTIIGGSIGDRKLFIGLPGHPLSCMVAVLFVVLPLIGAMCGAGCGTAGKYCMLPLAEDVSGRSGSDEFIPVRVDAKGAHPLAAKSGYVSAMRRADGFIRLRPDTETLRKRETAEVWLW